MGPWQSMAKHNNVNSKNSRNYKMMNIRNHKIMIMAEAPEARL